MTAVVEATIGVRVGDWEAAIRAAAQPLLDAGAVDPRYVERCIEMVHEHGPYMVLAPGIALAHARPEDGVRTLGLTVAVLADGVDFGHPDNDPVDVVFAFGSPDADQHLGLLAALAGDLEGGLAKRLRSVDDVDSARRLLHELVSDV